MSDILVVDNGLIRRRGDIEFVEDILKARKNKSHWDVIDMLVKHWAEKSPDEVEAVQINVRQYKESQIDKKFATTLHGKDMDRRMKLAFPYRLNQMIRSIYKHDELPMESEFYDEFAKRYPAFLIPESV